MAAAFVPGACGLEQSLTFRKAIASPTKVVFFCLKGLSNLLAQSIKRKNKLPRRMACSWFEASPMRGGCGADVGCPTPLRVRIRNGFGISSSLRWDSYCAQTRLRLAPPVEVQYKPARKVNLSPKATRSRLDVDPPPPFPQISFFFRTVTAHR